MQELRECSDKIRAMMNKMADDLKRWVTTENIDQAFRTIPRHYFIDRIVSRKEGKAVEEPFDPDHPDMQVLKRVYDPGEPIFIKADPPSSTSAPGIMAPMLEGAGIEEGSRVLEIGTGSGYNAALLAYLTGHDSLIYSMDIQEDIVQAARSHLHRAGFPGVHTIASDGGYGYPEGAPYDVIIVTAGCNDIPPHWIEQLTEGGRLVVPWNIGTGCAVFRGEKRNTHLEGQFIATTGFMELQGDFEVARCEILRSSQHPKIEQLLACPQGEVTLADAWKADDEESSRYPIELALQLFCILEGYKPVYVVDENANRHGMGLWLDEGEGLMTHYTDCKEPVFAVHGSQRAIDELSSLFEKWTGLERPKIDDFYIRVYPIDETPAKPEASWLVRDTFTQRVFCLDHS